MFNGVNAANLGSHLAQYWRDRIDETASDVMGILNMGPAAGIGLIAFFRGLNAAFTGEVKLRSSGPESDVHPADILRGYLAAETVRLLEFSDAAAWADAIEEETDKDVATIRLAGQVITKENAKKSAKAVAVAVVKRQLPSLENHSLGNIQNWRDRDEDIVAELVALIEHTKRRDRQFRTRFLRCSRRCGGRDCRLGPQCQHWRDLQSNARHPQAYARP